jgi:hypothetical protein
VMNLHPMSYPSMQLLIFFSDLDVFLTGSKALDLVACPMFRGWSLDSA